MRLPAAATGVLAVLGLLPRVSRPMSVALLVGIGLQSTLPVAFILVTGRLVGDIPAAVRHGLDPTRDHAALMLLVLAAAIVGLQNVLAPIIGALSAVFGRAVDVHLQERAMAAVSRPMHVAHLEDPEVLDLVGTSQGIGTRGFMRPGIAVSSLAQLVPNWARSLGGAAILITFHWWLGLGWLALWPVLLYYLSREYIKVSEAGAGQSGALRRADYYCELALTPPAGKELRIWALSDWLISRFQLSWLLAMGPIWQARRPGRRLIWMTLAVLGLASGGTFALIAWSAVRGEIGLTSLAIFLQAALAAVQVEAFDDANMNLAYAGASVPALLTLEERVAVEPPGQTLPPGAPRESIRFEGVTMRYSGQLGNALRGIDLVIPAGRSIAIVGANGAGKTTLVKLLCGLYQPTAGRITVDGIDLVNVDPASWQRRVAAIYQDFARLHLSARDNIGVGSVEIMTDPATERTEHALKMAAGRAGILDVIESLPARWDTPLSRGYEGGTDLSGGQWQRIALARALFAVEGGATVLVLDEPTANLDVRAEAALYDRFLDITAGLTTILISHRFSTVRRADHIVVLERGEIVERGSHEELIGLDGRYAEMFRLQAGRFVDESVS